MNLFVKYKYEFQAISALRFYSFLKCKFCSPNFRDSATSLQPVFANSCQKDFPIFSSLPQNEVMIRKFYTILNL